MGRSVFGADSRLAPLGTGSGAAGSAARSVVQPRLDPPQLVQRPGPSEEAVELRRRALHKKIERWGRPLRDGPRLRHPDHRSHCRPHPCGRRQMHRKGESGQAANAFQGMHHHFGDYSEEARQWLQIRCMVFCLKKKKERTICFWDYFRLDVCPQTMRKLN